MKKILIVVLAFSTFKAVAQKAVNPTPYAKTITAADLKKHLYIVAGKDMEGRETATRGQRRAAAYIQNQFERIGLQPGNNGKFQQMYPVFQDSLVNASLEVNGKAFQMDRDFNASVNNIDATMRFSEIVVVGPGSADSLKNANLTGKLVLFFAPTPQQGGGRAQGQPNIAATLSGKGIAGLISVVGGYPRTTPIPRKGNQTLSLFRRTVSPSTFSVSENVAREILGKEFDAAKANTAAIKTYPSNIMVEVQKTTIKLESSNVLGIVPGTDLKDEYLFITAHYDHLGMRGDSIIFYGADDDGSGTVAVIEMAEAFAKAKAEGKGPRRSIVFMAVSGEEKGLWGSDYYGRNPIFPLEKTTADLNIDMIGRGDTARKGDTLNYIYVVGDDKLSSELKSISEGQNNKYTKLELDYKYNDPNDKNRIYYRSDHYNFAKNGVPIIFYYDGMLGSDYHKATDTPDKIHYEVMAKRAQLVFYTAWEMANRNEMLKRDIPLDQNVFNR